MGSFTSTAILVLLTARATVGYPGGPGSCNAGSTPVGSVHLKRANENTTGFLADGGYELTIDGMKVDPNASFPIEKGVSHTISLAVDSESGTNFFRGFLLRLDPTSDTDATKFLTSLDPNVESDLSLCQQFPGVGSLGHIANNNKPAITGSLTIPADVPSGDWTLDVTAVKFNTAQEGSFWYNTAFLLQIEGDSVGPPATAFPTASPLASTPVPSSSPTEAPTLSTPAPSGPPTGSPVESTPPPTDSPTEGPTTSTPASSSPPTGSPVESTPSPTESPTAGPTTSTPAPSSPPTGSPVDSTPSPTESPTAGPTASTQTPSGSPTTTSTESTTLPVDTSLLVDVNDQDAHVDFVLRRQEML